MKQVKQTVSINIGLYISLFLVTQITGLLLSLSISYILQDFIWGFVRAATINSFFLGLSLIGCSILTQNLIFKMRIVYIILFCLSIILGAGIIGLTFILFFEPTLFFYYSRGAVTFLFVNFLFIVALYISSSVLIIYREMLLEKEKSMNMERNQQNQIKMELLSSLETSNQSLEEAGKEQKRIIKKLETEISERKRAEALNRQQQEKLIQADKMASVGILVSGVAHEINNPNNYIQLNSTNLADVWDSLKPVLDKYAGEHGDFLAAGLPYSELRNEVGDLISGITEGSGRIKTIVESLKDFARQDPGRMNERVNVNSVIQSSIVILSNLIKKSSDKFSVSCSTADPAITGNRQKIEQVVINLLSNSCQALEDRSQAINITSSLDNAKRRVIIHVMDEGKGIKPGDMKHIMDPFYTTKRETGGTGLGLSITYNIIREHSGEIKVESELGKGTTFHVIFPVAD